MSQPLEYEQVSENASEGAQFGRTSTEKIAFYGATPIILNSVSSGLMVTTFGVNIGAQTATSTSPFGASTAAIMTSTFAAVSSLMLDMASLQAALNNIRTCLTSTGLMKGA